VPASLDGISLGIEVAGRHFWQDFPAAPNQTTTFTWDGRDAYGRPAQGRQPITVVIGYAYRPFYYPVRADFERSFARMGPSAEVVPSRASSSFLVQQTWKGHLGSWNALDQGLGGWSFDVHHAYDLSSRAVYLGDGRRRSAESLNYYIVNTVAGNGRQGYSGDGGPALEAGIVPPDIALGPDGTLYIADYYYSCVRRVGPDGIITTVAGNGTEGFSGDGGPATQALLNNPQGVAVAPDGSLFIADTGNDRVRRVGPDGIITTVAGGGGFGFSGDGGPATKASLFWPQGVAIGPDGSLFIADTLNYRVRRVDPDGTITTVAGNGQYGFGGDGGPATEAWLSYDLSGAAVDSEGNLYIGDVDNGRVRRIDTNGIITTVAGNPEREYRREGVPANDYLESITNPAGEAVRFGYTSDGLLTETTDPRGNTSRYAYDDMGRLIRAEDRAGGSQTFSRIELPNGYEVTRTTALGRTTTYRVEHLSTGDKRLVNTFGCGAQTETLVRTDGSTRITYPDGMVIELKEGPDPRFGMQSPIIKSTTITTPGGLKSAVSTDRSVSLADSNNPLSLKTLTDTVIVNGRTYTNVFDAATNQLATTTPTGRRFLTTFDARGRMIAKQSRGFEAVSYLYDSGGRLTTITHGSGAGAREFSFAYDTYKRLSSIIDPLSRAGTLQYDPAGRVTKQKLPGGREVSYSYDANGNIISITPPGRPSHAFNYTPANRIEAYIPPDVGAGTTATTYIRALDKQITKIIRPDGTSVDFSYDSAGRPDVKTISQGAVCLRAQRPNQCQRPDRAARPTIHPAGSRRSLRGIWNSRGTRER
jgi:YD repeat-containing protein